MITWLRMHACLRQGHYFTSFKVPDVYGVYKFMVTYHRQGYTALDLTQTVRCTLLPTCSSAGSVYHPSTCRLACAGVRAAFPAQ